MNPEFAKIEAYFREGAALWKVNPKLVVSREFFELWQGAHAPLPFRLDADEQPIMDEVLYIGGEGGRIGYFDWDFTEECASLRVESDGADQAFLLLFQDAKLHVIEQQMVLLDEREVSLGERLEVMYDVIAIMRERLPTRNVLEMRRRDFVEIVAELAPDLDATTVRVIRRTPFTRIKELMGKAVQDMALDELSDQLTLPLDGSYAANLSPVPEQPTGRRATSHFRMPLRPRTKWQIICDLRFQQRTSSAMAEVEQAYVLTFQMAEILKEDGRSTWVIRVPTGSDVPISEGDRLQVFVRGEQSPIAMFHVDIMELASAIGRLVWQVDQPPDLREDKVFARPRRSPSGYISRMFEAMVSEFEKESSFRSDAIKAAMGVGEMFVEQSGLGATGEADLDMSQERGWANATNDSNPIAIIQGPPGTGKTHVLEKVLRTLIGKGQRVLVAAPSHTAVDNVCRRVLDQPLLRVGREITSLDPAVAEGHWIGDIDSVRAQAGRRKAGEMIYAGTHVGLMRDDVVIADMEKNGLFDVIIFDEAGMARMDEFLLCASLARRAVLFGDHQQLPPFPLPDSVIDALNAQMPSGRRQWATVRQSALEWLIEERQFPVYLLQSSYRCQNPRLMRFSSTLFYNARVKASAWAEYYRLSYAERVSRFPSSSLRFYSTSALPRSQRNEELVFEGGRPGIENQLEARLAIAAYYELLSRYAASEITIIAPYRRQVKLIRKLLDRDEVIRRDHGCQLPEGDAWIDFVRARISTVDSFQGGESDAVIICYVRSNNGGGIGFVDDPNRVNVAHTRCRREMVVIGDLECLIKQARSDLFRRMSRAIRRDGEIIELKDAHIRALPDSLPT